MAMTYFVTGATGFIGRNLVERLLAREGRILVLVRAGSRERLEKLLERWGPAARERVTPVLGDLSSPRLGLGEEQIAELRGTVEHFLHLAAIYDMTADAERNQILNVEGTRNAVELANALEAGIVHHVSSVAVAGGFRGTYREDMFDEGQPLTHPYHRTKFESERIVRTATRGAWRVYRPAIVVGDSRTGAMDKIDGPYYFFKALQRLAAVVPSRLPLIGVGLGATNIVPVDYVADAIDHIAHEPGLDGRAFHLASPEPQPVTEVLSTFARAAGAPQPVATIENRFTEGLPQALLGAALRLPISRQLTTAVLHELGIPPEVIEFTGFTATFDTRDAERALASSDGIAVPPLESYAAVLWEYWERRLDPDVRRGDRSLAAAINGKTVVITGASSGIGRATALKVAAAGGIPLLVARDADKLEQTRSEIEERGGSAYVYSADLADGDSVDELVRRMLAEHPAIDYLVNNAGRSIRRSVALSYDRFHDFERTMALNYFGALRLILRLLPHMRERRFGHIVNVSSIGVQTSPPRFSAYVASKAALDAFTRVAGSETIGDNVTFTTIHMPLVRTPMISPTKLYDRFPAISPDEAADMICDALRTRRKHVGTRLGTTGEVLYALSPRTVDQILHLAYRVFPDSAAAKGRRDPDEHASVEQLAMAHLMRGVHW